MKPSEETENLAKDEASTPLMRQYLAIKAQHQDAILFFRMGDFYEMFYDDAKTASTVLGLTLTARAHGKAAEVPLAGFPHHALETYLNKMVRAGHRVAICEQTEDPKLAKIVVKREVTEIVTPGTALADGLLNSRRNNFLLAIYPAKKMIGLAQLDFSTGEFLVEEVPGENLKEILQDIEPAEILIATEYADWLQQQLRNVSGALVTARDGWLFAYDHAYSILTRHFRTLTLKGFGCDDLTCGVSAAGATLSYVSETQKGRIDHITHMARRQQHEFVGLDPATRRNLELVRSLRGEAQHATLLNVLDRTRTAMGGRMLVQWILHPLRNLEAIRERHEALEEFIANQRVREGIAEILRGLGDLERLISKVSTARANARELSAVRAVQEQMPGLKNLLQKFESRLLHDNMNVLEPLPELTEELRRALVEDPPLSITEGNIFRPGYSVELDQLHHLTAHGKDWIARLQTSERERTGISSLKVGYNRVFGYYIEVTNPNLAKVPDAYIRKQTLSNAERYITPELKEYEEQVLQAEEKMVALEYRLFEALRQKVATQAASLQRNARALATIDCLLSLAELAQAQKYVRPVIDDSSIIDIKQGRHPVVEKLLPFGEAFVPNDTYLDELSHQILLITGPNMAGKSTYLRQVALIILMAQMGSFVPAAEARIGVADKIFTRVGASDNLAGGESTFLVEMNETANILNNATARSLVLLDEIGRGTSTYDGLSIAWAVVEYMHDNPKVAARTLFATHYHELMELANRHGRVKNYNVLVKEWGDQVVFLRRIVEGGCDHSYGIQVAQLAGMPAPVIQRAKQVLTKLEQQSLERANLPEGKNNSLAIAQQVDLFSEQEFSLREELLALEIDTMTPLQALQKLAELQKVVVKGKPFVGS